MEAVTQASLLEAIAEALRDVPQDPEEGVTAHELADHFGCDVIHVRRRIGRLLKDGRAQCVRVRRPRIDGVVQKVPGYRIVG